MKEISEQEKEFAEIKFEIAKIQFNYLAMSKDKDAIEANPSTHRIALFICNLLEKERKKALQQPARDEDIKTAEEILNEITGTSNHKERKSLIHIDFVLDAMEEYASQLKRKPTDEEIKEWAHNKAVERLRDSNFTPIVIEINEFAEEASIMGAKAIRDGLIPAKEKTMNKVINKFPSDKEISDMADNYSNLQPGFDGEPYFYAGVNFIKDWLKKHNLL